MLEFIPNFIVVITSVRLKNSISLEDTLKKARDNCGTMIVDHPFYLKGIGNYLEKNLKLLKYIDAIEVYNGEAAFGLPVGPFPKNANEKAQKFYSEVRKDFPHLGAIASSDGHSISEIGSSYTEIDKPEYNKNFIYSLRNSVRDANLNDCKKMNPSFFSSMKHISELVGIIASEKVGYKGFKTERPDELGLSI